MTSENTAKGTNFVSNDMDLAMNILNEAMPGLKNETGMKQGTKGFRIDSGMSGNGIKNWHDGLHINY